MTATWNVSLRKLSTDASSAAISLSIEQHDDVRSVQQSSQQVLGSKRSKLSFGQTFQEEPVKEAHDESRNSVWKAVWDWNREFRLNHGAEVGPLDGYWNGCRIASWGTICPPSSAELLVRESVAAGLGVNDARCNAQMRPIYVLGTWQLGKSARVSWYMLAPAICTASFPHKTVTYDELASLDSRVNTLSPPSTGRQSYSINADYGRRIVGRLCPSFVTLIERDGAEGEILASVNDFSFLHMTSSRLLACLSLSGEVIKLGVTLNTLRKLERLAPRHIAAKFDGRRSLEIRSASEEALSNTGMMNSEASNSFIGIGIYGEMKYQGKPSGVQPCFRDLVSLVHTSMSNNDSAVGILSTLTKSTTF